MQSDPFQARRTGAHRLRVVTASIGAAAVVGTGALAWSVAAGTASASTGQSSSDDGSTGTSGSDDSFVQSPTMPQTSVGGNAHASSGAS
jgi:hypothetical protein